VPAARAASWALIAIVGISSVTIVWQADRRYPAYRDGPFDEIPVATSQNVRILRRHVEPGRIAPPGPVSVAAIWSNPLSTEIVATPQFRAVPDRGEGVMIAGDPARIPPTADRAHRTDATFSVSPTLLGRDVEVGYEVSGEWLSLGVIRVRGA
jgi:hypothetical protein